MHEAMEQLNGHAKLARGASWPLVTLLVLVGALAGGVAVAWWHVPRYVVQVDGARLVRMDTRTGETWVSVWDAGWNEVPEPRPQFDPNAPAMVLPPEQP